MHGGFCNHGCKKSHSRDKRFETVVQKVGAKEVTYRMPIGSRPMISIQAAPEHADVLASMPRSEMIDYRGASITPDFHSPLFSPMADPYQNHSFHSSQILSPDYSDSPVEPAMSTFPAPRPASTGLHRNPRNRRGGSTVWATSKIEIKLKQAPSPNTSVNDSLSGVDFSMFNRPASTKLSRGGTPLQTLNGVNMGRVS